MNETADFCNSQKQNCQLLTMGEGGQGSDFEEIVVRWVSRVEQENELVETLQSRDAKTLTLYSLGPVLLLLLLNISTLNYSFFLLILGIFTLIFCIFYVLIFPRQKC